MNKDAPPGRAFALELPEALSDGKWELLTAGGIIYCLEKKKLLYPLEAVCRKVRIPGVRYREEGDL